MGLRRLYFLIDGEHVEGAPEIPVWLSLSVILGVLTVTTVTNRLKAHNRT